MFTHSNVAPGLQEGRMGGAAGSGRAGLSGRTGKIKKGQLPAQFPNSREAPDNAQVWLPNNSSPALDVIPKPYYCGTNNTRQRRLDYDGPVWPCTHTIDPC